MKSNCPCDECRAKRKLDREMKPRHGSKALRPKSTFYERIMAKVAAIKARRLETRPQAQAEQQAPTSES